MADNIDNDIDEIMGLEDLDLDIDGQVEGTPEDQGVEDTEKSEETVVPDDGTEEGEPEGEPEGEQVQQTEEPPEGEQEAPKPLTADDIRTVISDMRNEERTSTKELDGMTDEILKQYYPDGLSNVLVDKTTNKELRTPQDVVDASDGTMSMEEATQWLMNQQYKLDADITKIKDEAREMAEINYNFSSGIERVMEKYKDVFEKFPDQQQKVYKQYMKQVKLDNEKEIVLSAPDIEEFYDFAMEPYVLAYGNIQTTQQQTSAPPQDAKAEIPDAKPSINDRLDEFGDGGGGKREADPNNADESLKELFGE